MVASRVRVLRASYSARFWLSAFCISLMPTSVGYQDLAALIVHRPHIYASYSGEHLIASPFGTIERATFSFTRPVGSVITPPLEFQNVNFDPRALDAYAWKVDEALTGHATRQVEYPTVNRTNKGDRLPPAAPAAVDAKTLPQLQPIDAPAAPAAAPVVAPVIAPQPIRADVHAEGEDAAPSATPGDATKVAGPAAPDAGAVAMDAANPASAPQPASLAAVANANPATSVLAPAASHFDQADNTLAPRATFSPDRSNVPGGGDDAIAIADKPPEIPQPAEQAGERAGEQSGKRPGEMQPGAMTVAQSSFSESFIDGSPVDHSAQIYFGGSIMGAPASIESWAPGAEPILVTPPGAAIRMSSLEETDNDEYGGDEIVTGKDESRVLSPAQRLGLAGPARAEAQKCLSDAIYFEARGEVMKGQEAVAQVVMNRVFSGYYPHDVCGVVYQNAHHHLACQFTFACEGKDLNKIDEPDMWEQAKQIARDTLDGKIWLGEVGHATHYHAYWVHPSWVHEMTRLYRLGVHTFYRPRNWGDGDDAPVWGPNAPPTEVSDDPASKADYLRPDPEVLSENPVPNPAAAEASVKGPEASALQDQTPDKVATAAKL
jgi:spore germination cell wall hydrolase CwlJ-like protein